VLPAGSACRKSCSITLRYLSALTACPSTARLSAARCISLCRLRYGGSAHSFGFAIYSAAHDRYQDAVLVTGLPIGTPQEALDTACTVHLAGLGHEPAP
jgi:hypothetical protein